MWVPTTVSGGGGGGYATGVRQIVTSKTSAVLSSSTILPADNTIPQSTEGSQFITATITPQSATSTILVIATVGAMSPNAICTVTSALFRDSAASAFAAGAIAISTAGFTTAYSLVSNFASGATSATTIKLRVGANVGSTVFLNGYPGPTSYFGGVCSSTLTLIEYGI